jgi:hypothetical protein
VTFDVALSAAALVAIATNPLLRVALERRAGSRDQRVDIGTEFSAQRFVDR